MSWYWDRWMEIVCNTFLYSGLKERVSITIATTTNRTNVVLISSTVSLPHPSSLGWPELPSCICLSMPGRIRKVHYFMLCLKWEAAAITALSCCPEEPESTRGAKPSGWTYLISSRRHGSNWLKAKLLSSKAIDHEFQQCDKRCFLIQSSWNVKMIQT